MPKLSAVCARISAPITAFMLYENAVARLSGSAPARQGNHSDVKVLILPAPQIRHTSTSSAGTVAVRALADEYSMGKMTSTPKTTGVPCAPTANVSISVTATAGNDRNAEIIGSTMRANE